MGSLPARQELLHAASSRRIFTPGPRTARGSGSDPGRDGTETMPAR